MENPTDSICDTDYKSLVNQCLEICSALKDKGCKFSLSLRLGLSFNLSLSSEGPSPEATKRTRRSPSYLRRQTRRRAAFLARKEKHPLAEVVTPNNQACRQGGATLLDKKTASSWQTATSEGETVVDNNCSLDLNPNPTLPRGPDESMESHDSIENVCENVFDKRRGAPLPKAERAAMEAIEIRIRQRDGEGYAKQGSNCEDCQQIIVDKRLRY